MEEAVRRGDLSTVQRYTRVVPRRSDWESYWTTDASLLALAVEKGYEEIALELLAAQRLRAKDLWAVHDVACVKELEGVIEKVKDRLMNQIQSEAHCIGMPQKRKDILFRHACHKGRMLPIRSLLQSGCHVSGLSREEQEDLLLRAFDQTGKFVGDMFVVRALLHTVHVSFLQRVEQEELLLHACGEGDLFVVDTLVANGCNVNCTSFERCTPIMVAANAGCDEIVKKLILANAKVLLPDIADGNTALHYAARKNHIQCGVLLAEAGASVRTKNRRSLTPLDEARSAEFVEAVEQALSFTTRKTLCIVGNAESGKSTLIAALQAESSSFLGKIFNHFRRVDDIRKRTTGIETIPHVSQKYGEVLFFDFAGQHEYHGPHQMFLEALLSKPGVSMTLLLVVKATEEEEAMLHQLHRWLTPVALMATTASPPQVIVIGSFLDKVKSKNEATAKLTRCIEATRKELEELPLEFVGTCFLNCRQPQSEGMNQLVSFLEKVPVPELKATHMQYSLAWVLSQFRLSFKTQAVQLQELSKWMEDNERNLPQTMPPPEVICQDLSAAGHALYLPNKEDPHRSWLVLEIPSILHDVYGTLFSQSKQAANEFGLLHRRKLASLFPNLTIELVQQLLVSLEFCIPVDMSVLKVEMNKLTQCEDTSGWLFFPAFISAKPPSCVPQERTQHGVRCLCWQLRTSKKHSISARVLQTILLRLAAHFVVKQRDEEGVQHHCCSIWWNGIEWQSKRGVDITVHVFNNRIIQVVSSSAISADKSCHYLSDVISDILSTVQRLSHKLSAAAYIVHPPIMAALRDDVTAPPPKELFLVEDIRNSIAGHENFTLSRKDAFGHSARLPVCDLFGGWNPSLEDVERILWTQPEPSQY